MKLTRPHKRHRLAACVIAISYIMVGAAGCSINAEQIPNNIQITHYLDVSGITTDEIAAIEALQNRGEPLVYASARSTELFELRNGELGGYTALLCDWLTELFDVQFEPKIMSLGAMLESLANGEISFATLSATAERREAYHMVDIAQRSLVMLRAEGSQPLNEIKQNRLPRYVFTEGSVMSELAMGALESSSYEAVIVPNEDSAYQALVSDAGDAFIATNTLEAAFDHYGGVYAEDFLPLIFLPAAMTAEKSEYEAIISIVEKAVQGGAHEHLAGLYSQGYQDYRKHKFNMLLTDSEIEYIRDSDAVPFVTMYMTYPNSFYNTQSGQWEGIVFDVLDEISKLTGLEFKLVNDQTVEFPQLLSMVESAEAHFMPNMILTNQRREQFLFSSTLYLPDQFTLISKRQHPNIELNDLLFEKVALPQGTAFAEVFWNWFPNASNAKEYPNTDEAFSALDRGEVDLVMSSLSRLTALTNYYELSDFKANYVFDTDYQATFGFNKDQPILHSIIDKALPMAGTGRIVQQWGSKTYNIETMRLQAQRPWFAGATVVSLALLTLVFILFNKARRATVQFEAAANEAYEASRAKSDFLAKMSHEIRTPMNAIIGLTELSLQEENPETSRSHTVAVKHASAALLSLIDDILDFSKIETGSLEMVLADYSPASLIDDVVSIIKFKDVNPQIQFTVKTSKGMPAVLLGDKTRIRQILLNILNNAFKYTEKGFISFNVRSGHIDGDTINMIFEVSDSGRGIKEEDIEHLFDGFSQFETDKSENIEGVGLGLAITHQLLELMGGSISVRSVYGEGSTFIVILPQKHYGHTPEAADEKHEDKNGNNTAPGIKFTAPDAKILIVDDIKTNLIVAKGLMRPYGINADTCTGGQEALEALESKEYDLVFMDHKMPGMDGLETTERIRQLSINDPYYLDLPVVALTANAVADTRDMFLENGFNDFLSKPIDVAKLDGVLRKWLPDEKVYYDEAVQG